MQKLEWSVTAELGIEKCSEVTRRGDLGSFGTIRSFGYWKSCSTGSTTELGTGTDVLDTIVRGAGACVGSKWDCGFH